MASRCPDDCPPAIHHNKHTRDEEDENLHDHHESNSPPQKHGDQQHIRPVAGSDLGGNPPGSIMPLVAAIIGSLITWFFYATSQGSCTEAPLSVLCVPYWAAISLEGDCSMLSDGVWIAIGVVNAILYGLLGALVRRLLGGGRKNPNVQPTCESQKFEINDTVRYKNAGVDINGVIASNLPSQDGEHLLYRFHKDGTRKVPELFKVNAGRLTKI